VGAAAAALTARTRKTEPPDTNGDGRADVRRKLLTGFALSNPQHFAGATFTGRRAKEGVEFLASTDSWFRPVNLTVGPDGALYLVDYYRKVIEHPEWASTSVATSPDLYVGQDRGRVYRIVPAPAPR